MFEFKEEFRTGIEEVDKEHEKLFEIANRTYNTLMDEFIPDKYDYIVEIINELKEYATVHFQNEEEYMVKVGYKKLFSQKIAHNKFIEKINEYDLDYIDENQKDVILDMMEFVGNWLVEHILESDKQIGDFVAEQEQS